MITLRPSAARGHADHGWLDARHSFSFASYHDPAHMGFMDLRVLNQDRVRPGQGFATHGHRDMEIVTWVLEGRLAHKDSMGNGSELLPGEVQLMSAGRGVLHSEFNPSEEEPLHLLQMWVLPAVLGGAPGYQQKAFPPAERRGKLRLVVSPDGRDGSLKIQQDARMFVGDFDRGESSELVLGAGRAAWLHVPRGQLKVNGQVLSAGDGAAIRGEERLTLEGLAAGEAVLWDLLER